MTREYIVERGKFLVVVGCAMIGFVIVMFGIIAVTRPNGIDTYVTVVGPIIASMIALVALGAQMEDVRKDVRAVNDKVNTIEKQTNGAMTAQFADVKEHVTGVVRGRRDGDAPVAPVKEEV